jgi:hypothetical protein
MDGSTGQPTVTPHYPHGPSGWMESPPRRWPECSRRAAGEMPEHRWRVCYAIMFLQRSVLSKSMCYPWKMTDEYDRPAVTPFESPVDGWHHRGDQRRRVCCGWHNLLDTTLERMLSMSVVAEIMPCVLVGHAVLDIASPGPASMDEMRDEVGQNFPDACSVFVGKRSQRMW